MLISAAVYHHAVYVYKTHDKLNTDANGVHGDTAHRVELCGAEKGGWNWNRSLPQDFLGVLFLDADASLASGSLNS